MYDELLNAAKTSPVDFLRRINETKFSERKNLLNKLLKEAEAHPEQWQGAIKNLKAAGAESSVIAVPISAKEINNAQPAIQESEPPATADTDVIEKLPQVISQQKASQAEPREEPFPKTTPSVVKDFQDEINKDYGRYSQFPALQAAAANLSPAFLSEYLLPASMKMKNIPVKTEAGSVEPVKGAELMQTFIPACESVLSQAMSAEEKQQYYIKIVERTGGGGKTILSVLQGKIPPKDDPTAKLEVALRSQREIVTLTFDIPQEDQIHFGKGEFKGLGRFKFAEKILPNPDVLFSNPILLEKIKQTCNDIAIPRFGEASAKAVAYQKFIFLKLSQLKDLTIEGLKLELQKEIKQLSEEKWAPNELDELKECLMLTFMLVTGFHDIQKQDLQALSIDGAQYLLEYLSAILGGEISPKPNKNITEEMKAKTENIIQNLLIRINKELYELIAIISEYLQEKHKQGSSPDKLPLLIKAIIVEGILNEPSDPGKLYDDLAKSGHRKTLFTPADVLTTILEKLPKERFISHIQKLHAQKISPADMQDILPFLDDRMQLIKEDYTGKKECENAIKELISSFSVQGESADSSPAETVRIIDSDSDSDSFPQDETVRIEQNSPRPENPLASLFWGPPQNPSAGPDRHHECS